MAPLPLILWRSPFLVATSRILWSGSMAMMKSNGDTGSPCRRPCPCLIGSPAIPLRMILEEKLRRAAIKSLNLLGDPRRWRRSSKYSHFTESKALRMSSLKRRDGVFLLCRRRARLRTYKKLPSMLLVLMKALWALETRFFMCGPSLMDSTFAIIFAIAWMRLMGL